MTNTDADAKPWEGIHTNFIHLLLELKIDDAK